MNSWPWIAYKCQFGFKLITWVWKACTRAIQSWVWGQLGWFVGPWHLIHRYPECQGVGPRRDFPVKTRESRKNILTYLFSASPLNFSKLESSKHKKIIFRDPHRQVLTEYFACVNINEVFILMMINLCLSYADRICSPVLPPKADCSQRPQGELQGP